MVRKGSMWIAMFGMILIGIYQWFFAMSLSPITETPQQAIVTIPSGASLSSIGRQLSDAGLIDYPIIFNAVVRLSQKESKLRAGDFRIDTTWHYQQLLEHLIKDPEVQYSITLIEGMTIKDAMKQIQSHEKIKRSLPDVDVNALKALFNVEQYPEGMMLPDTYFIRAGANEAELYRRAYVALTDVLAREWSRRNDNLPFTSAYQALIAASVVEKETGKPEERPLIAAVIVNRLKKGMPLQMDPTVIYGLGDRFDGNIRKKDLSDMSPYNTYTHKGLPPTPIALASAESLYAVLHPAPSDALYFVARGDGSHQFSSTLEAHNAAVKQFQLGGK